MSDTEHRSLRTAILGERVGLNDLAAALGITRRSVYDLIERHKIPYIRVLNRRYFNPAEVRRALESDVIHAQSRPRGRPRNK